MSRLMALVVVLALTGCASLPMSGPVRIGPDLTPNTGAESFYYSPSSPVDDASKAEILNGFLAAGTGPQNDYAVAREFLSETIRSTWNPNQEVLIQRASPVVTIGEGDVASLEVDVSARVDADGKYEPLPMGSKKVLDFAFVREQGQWRLSKVPDATVLIRPVFDVIFRGYSIYFLDRQKTTLVPELRWFPETPATGTRLANALLRGASTWLRPAVVSAIPSGTRLSIDAVTVEDGVALVDLTARALVATRLDRQLMKAQLDATLSQLPSVQSVAVAIERSPQEITDLAQDLTNSSPRSLVVLSADGLEGLGGSESDLFNPSKEFFQLNPSSRFAISRTSASLAVVTGAGLFRTSALDAGAAVQQLDSRPGVIALEFDKQGYLWSFARARGSAAIVITPEGQRFAVSAPWLAAEAVRGFSLSPEGTRAVFMVQGASRNRVLISSVVRNQGGTPVELSAPIEIAPEIASPNSIAWLNSMTIAVLNSPGDFNNAYLVDVGGTSRIIPAISKAESLTAGGTPGSLYLVTTDGELHVFGNASWSLVRDGVIAVSRVN